MKRHSWGTAATLLTAACCLAGCSIPTPVPTLRVTSVSVSEGKEMARQFCADLAKMSDEKAIDRMATRAAVAELSSEDLDAIADYAAAVTCPSEL